MTLSHDLFTEYNKEKDKNEYKWLTKHECYKVLKYNIATACVILETKCKNVNKTMWQMLIILYKLLYANFQEFHDWILF